ncbi:amino acid transporter [Lichtheimia corymbifera JMRC:FSU:9682]|uniref:Amino acid transporter n=1 Tax=Lichtheimia corymbifera JMRC:FSU:9682 TaxID=1263082 RepID=A0A068RWF5_9FUNG|nr:amino acid transporter [Lichtheimia corymbifera JMRC:FSU:9682]
MERSLTVDLPVEQVARVVKRHLVLQPANATSSGSTVQHGSEPSPIASQIPRQHQRRSNSHNRKRNNSESRAGRHAKQQQRREQDHTASPAPSSTTTTTTTTTSDMNQMQGAAITYSSSSTTPVYSTHHLLPGGAIVDEIYKWTARVDNEQRWRRQRAESISLPATRQPVDDPLLQSLKQPGGFRRHHVLTQAARQGKSPNFVTSSFVDFLCLYGHFGGEDLSDDDDDGDDSSLSSYTSSDGAATDSADSNTGAAGTGGGSVMAYRGNMLNRASYQSCDPGELPLPATATSNNHHQSADASTSSYTRYHQHHYPVRSTHETMPLLPSHNKPSRSVQDKATPGKAMFLLLKSFVTTGIMFLPRAFYNGGLLFSIIGVIAWALISLCSFLLLVQTRLVVHASFADMAGVLYGRSMKLAVLFAITLSQIGFVCAYMVFVAENIQSLVLAFSKCRVLIPMHLLVLAQSFVFIPLAMIRKIQRLSVFALIADVFIVIGLGYMFYYDMLQLSDVGVAHVDLWNPSYFPLFIGTVAFTYEGIGLVIPIAESMKEPSKFPSVLRRVLGVITVLFIALGAISYLTFGEDVQTIILLNLPSKDPMVSSIQTLYSLAICLSIPLQLFPAIRIMENGLFTTRSGKNNAVVKWQKNVFRVLVVFLCAWIAIVGSKDKLDKFVPLIGALFCIPLCFVFPPLFHLKAMEELPTWRRVADVALILFGAIGSIFVASATLYQWNSGGDDILDPVKQCIVNRT